MKRFEDIIQDHQLLNTIDNLQYALKYVQRLSDKLTVMQAALDSIGVQDTEMVSPSEGGYG